MLKRLFDIIISGSAIFILLPFFLLIGLLVRFTSAGPAIYWSERIGKDSASFMMPKFRSMRIETPELATDKLGAVQTYLTPIGAFLRKTSLDELPQLMSVLQGHMSIVGPRPALFNQYELIEMRKNMRIDSIRPGITGWAQINGRDTITDQEKCRLDLEYIEKMNFLFDIKIIFLTVFSVLRSQGIRH